MIKRLNMAPGPTDFSHLVDPNAMGEVFPHFSEAFKTLFDKLGDKLKELLGTSNPVLFAATSGTGGIEALLTNMLSVGDKVLILSNGFFGDRLLEMAQTLGLNALKLDFDWERPIDPGTAKTLVLSNLGNGVKAVLMVHLESSTGIINDLSQIGEALRDTNVAFLVDAVGSVATCPIEIDEWNVDGLACTSYKGLRSPAGVSIIVTSDKYRVEMNKCDRPNYSLSLKKILEQAKGSMTLSTAPVSAMLLLDNQLEALFAYGLEKYYEDCKAQANAMREALSNTGFQVFGSEGLGSSITATLVPQQLRHVDLAAILEAEFSLYVGPGLGKLHDSTIRFAHYGGIRSAEIEYAISCVGKVLKEHGASTS